MKWVSARLFCQKAQPQNKTGKLPLQLAPGVARERTDLLSADIDHECFLRDARGDLNLRRSSLQECFAQRPFSSQACLLGLTALFVRSAGGRLARAFW